MDVFIECRLFAYFVIPLVNPSTLFGEDLVIFVAQIINLLYNVSHLDTLQINILR